MIPFLWACAEGPEVAAECTDGDVLDEAGVCVPETCGTSLYGDSERGDGAVFVDPARGGGDGSEGSPYASIGDALAAGATELHLAAGTYAESFDFKGGDPLIIAGRCRELVTIDTSGSDKYGIRLKNGADLTMSGLLLTGAPHIGLALDDATASLTDVDVVGNSWHGVNVAGGSRFTMVGGSIADTQPIDGEGGYGFLVQEASVAEVTRTVITRNAGLGIGLLGGELRAHGVEVSDTVASDLWGEGVGVWDGSTFITDEATLITRNVYNAIDVATLYDSASSTVKLTDTTVADTTVWTFVDGDGYSASASGMWVSGNAEVTLTRCSFSGSPTGVMAWGQSTAGEPYAISLAITDSTFTGASPLPDVGDALLLAPSAIAAYNGVIVEASGLTISTGYSPGIIVDSSSELTIANSTIESLALDDGQFAFGMLVSNSGVAYATNLTVSDIAGAGVDVREGGVLDAAGLVIEGIHAAALLDAGDFGDGLFGFDADITVDGGRFSDIDGLAVTLRGGTATLSNVEISDVHRVSPETPGEGITAQTLAGDPVTTLAVYGATISGVEGIGVFLNGPETIGTFDDVLISDGRYSSSLDLPSGSAGLVVQDGAQGTVTNATITNQPGVGILVNGGESDPDATDVVDAVLVATEVSIEGVRADLDNPAVGVTVQAHARFTGTRVEVHDAGDVGLYTIIASSLECTDCAVDGFELAGAIAQADGALALHNTTITGTGSTAFGLYGSGRYFPASLVFDEGSSVEAGGLAAAYFDGAGAWELADCDLGSGVGATLGDVLVHGNAIFAYGTTAWDGSTETGLAVTGCALHDSPGPALLLQEGTASVCDLDLADNEVDSVWQGCPSATEPGTCAAEDLGASEACPEATWSYLEPDSVGLYFVIDDVPVTDGG